MPINNAAQARAATQANRQGRSVNVAPFVAAILAKVEAHVAPYKGRPRRPGMDRVLPYIINPMDVEPGTPALSEEEEFYAIRELEQAGFAFGRLSDGTPYMGWL